MSSTNTLGQYRSTLPPEPDAAQMTKVAKLFASALDQTRPENSLIAADLQARSIERLLRLTKARERLCSLALPRSRGDVVVGLITSLFTSDPAWPNGPNALPAPATSAIGLMPA